MTDLRALLNLAPSERAAEQMNQNMARTAEIFQVHQSPPEPATEGEILVAAADGKGVPMRRPLEERTHRSHPRRGKGEKANKKPMAYVGAVSSIDPFPRSAADVVDEVCRKRRAADRPEPQNKQMWAEMTRCLDDNGATGRERVFLEMAMACKDRDPDRTKTLVCLLDGERALWQMAGEWLPQAVGVLDLFHVLERLWINAAITYYENNRGHMKYDEYLAAGYPIGSGVAEGVCRHLVKDRMEGTGMRWTVPGAQAMLHLRAVYLNGRWDEFIEHHAETERTRLYGKAAA